MTVVNVSMEKFWDYFDPLKPEEKYQEVSLLAFMIQKFCIFSKNKKKKLPINFLRKTFSSE